MTARSVLITGVTGFIGRHLARHFAQAQWNVIGFGTRPAENAPIQDLHTYRQIVLPSPDLSGLLQPLSFDVCIHCIGRASVELSVTDPAADFRASADATFNLLDAIRQHQPHARVIFLSSAAVYGNPTQLPVHESHTPSPISPYGFHKLICEQLCQEFSRIYNIPTASLRIFSAYGPGLRRQVMWDICRKALTQPVLNMRGTGDESRDFVHVLDIAKAIYLLTGQAPCEGETYNLASGIEVPIRQLARLLLEELDLAIPVHFDQQSSEGVPKKWLADISKLQRLGFQPSITLHEGVASYAKWCRAEIHGH